jgi:hypothetical protein
MKIHQVDGCMVIPNQRLSRRPVWPHPRGGPTAFQLCNQESVMATQPTSPTPPTPGASGAPAPSTGGAAAAPKQIEKLKPEKEFLKNESKETIKPEKDIIKEKHEKHEKSEWKEHKDAKNEKLEKNELKEHKDAKNEKLEKNEIKEHKDSKHEKIEKPEHKEFLKPEAKENIKPEFKEQEVKSPASEGPLLPGNPATLPGQPGAGSQAHFISSDNRPDLSRGALKDEPDTASGASAQKPKG